MPTGYLPASTSVLDDFDQIITNPIPLVDRSLTRVAAWPEPVDLSHLPDVITRLVAQAPPLSNDEREEFAVLLR